jgi:hypothetical protein
MKHEIELRFRPESMQSVCERHKQVTDYLYKLNDNWKVSGLPKAEEPAPGCSEYFNLKKYTPKHLGGDLSYSSRESLKDHKSSDDYLVYEFASDYIGVKNIDQNFIQNIISTLSPYYMYIGNSEFTHIDKNTRRKLNLRNDFCRFFPVTYFDDILCNRKFGLSAADFVTRYGEDINNVYLVNGGVLFISSDFFCDINTSEAINESVWETVNKSV